MKVKIRGNFEVTISKIQVVTPALPLKEQTLPLSNLDLLLPPVDVGVFFCYKKPDYLKFGSTVSVLKTALAETLVPYQVLAGELVKNGGGEAEILCNNRGVDFVEAFADVELKDLNLYNPDQSVEGKLVPEKKHGVLSIQVTQLKCGGVVVACTFAHQVADAYSANMFLVSWAEMARSNPISNSPSFRRSLLSHRCPGGYHLSVDNMYVPISALPTTTTHEGGEPAVEDKDGAAVSRIYYVKADRVNEIQELANSDDSAGKENRIRATKLVSFSAFLWKTIASGKFSGDDDYCRLGIVVDGRNRLIDGNEKEAKLMASYFGNVLSVPFGEKIIKELKQKSLNWVANEVREFLQSAVTKDHFLGLIDWVEEHRPEPALAKIYAAKATAKEPAVVVSSGQCFPVRKMDFGWGRPAFGSYHFPWGGKSGYVMPMPSPKGNGDWVVYIHMLKAQLDLIETIAPHVFTPLTSDYLFPVT